MSTMSPPPPYSFPTRSRSRLPPPFPLPTPYVRLVLGHPATRTPFLSLSPPLLTLLPSLLSSPALTLTLCSTGGAPLPILSHPAYFPIAPVWLDIPLSAFPLTIEASPRAGGGIVLGIAALPAAALSAPYTADSGVVPVALLSQENSSVLTTLTFSYLILSPSSLPTPTLPSNPFPATPTLTIHDLSAPKLLWESATDSVLDIRVPRGPSPRDLSGKADDLLAAVAAHGAVAALICDSPDLCVLLTVKQVALPVLCRLPPPPDAAENETWLDPRLATLTTAVRFGQSVGLRGICCSESAVRDVGVASARNCGMVVLVEGGDDVEKVARDVGADGGVGVGGKVVLFGGLLGDCAGEGGGDDGEDESEDGEEGKEVGRVDQGEDKEQEGGERLQRKSVSFSDPIELFSRLHQVSSSM